MVAGKFFVPIVVRKLSPFVAGWYICSRIHALPQKELTNKRGKFISVPKLEKKLINLSIANNLIITSITNENYNFPFIRERGEQFIDFSSETNLHHDLTFYLL